MPKKVALLIGVSECGDLMPSRLEATDNVAAMQRVLQDPNLGSFDRVESLLNPDLETMQKAIQEAFAECGANDLALLFFSGYSFIDEESHLYFATRLTTKDDFKITAIPASFVQQQLSSCDAERQLLILECCYIDGLAMGLPKTGVSVHIDKELGARGRTILSSSTTIQTSLKPQGANLSPYTQYLVEGIETGTADRDGAGVIYVREWHSYAKEKVQAIAPELEPEIIQDEKDFDIVLTVLLDQQPHNDLEAEYRKIEAKYGKIVETYGRSGEMPHIVNYTLEKKQKTFGLTIDKDAPDELISDRGIDYTKLRDLLKAGEWQAADRETSILLFKAANREHADYLDTAAIENFPCADLHTVDNLWVKYSNGQFGFSLQKEIWVGLGGEPGQYNNAVYEQFGRRVGWRSRNGVMLLRGWMKYEDLHFSVTWAPVGHLPTMVGGNINGFEDFRFWGAKSNFFARMDACWL